MIKKQLISLVLVLLFLIILMGASLADQTVYEKPTSDDLQEEAAIEQAETTLCEHFSDIQLCLSDSILDHADALTAEDFYLCVIRQQAKSGSIEEWSTEQKILLVNWMAEAGIDIDDVKLLLLNSKDTSADDKEAIAEALIEKCYGPGRGGAITILDIMGKTKGDYETWTIEDKAWLTQMQQLYHDPNLGSLYPIQFLPDPAQGDILQEEAIAIAQKALINAFGLTQAFLDQRILCISFGLAQDMYYRLPGNQYDSHGDVRLWSVRFYSVDDPIDSYSVDMRNDGVILTLSTPDAHLYYADDILKD